MNLHPPDILLSRAEPADLGRAVLFWLFHGWWYLLAAFLIGSIPFGLVVSRLFFKTDIRASGSGNIGAANALRTLGRGAGVSVLVLDALKGAAAVLLPLLAMERGWPPFHRVAVSGSLQVDGLREAAGPAMCAIAAILGHCYSPWLHFKGGKGVATFLGVLLAVSWPSALVFVAVWLAVVLPTGLSSLGSMLGTLGGIAAVAYLVGPPTLYFSVPAAAIIVWQHRANVSRLLAGRENRLNLLKR